MDCSHALTLLNARLDGELTSAEDEAALDAHLAACSECRTAADALRVQDADLVRAFTPLRDDATQLACRVVAALDPPRPAISRQIVWPLLLAATAAGYLLAVFTWHPQPEAVRPDVAAIAPPIARLALATGPVEVQPPTQLQWFRCPTETELPPGATLRTEEGARCEVSTSDGSRVRLNGDSQAHFHGTRQVSLERGELWSQVADAAIPFSVTAANAKVMAQQGRISLSCQPGQTVVTVVEGTAHVESGKEKTTLGAGQSAQIIDGQLSETPSRADPLLVTSWINELLAAKGPDDPEFAKRMNDILAQLGQAKLSYLYEEEIRRLGDHCVLPLVRFLESSRSEGDQPRRILAASIVADVAQPRSIPLLIELLADDNSEVRAQAARGLQRLTTRDFGRSPAQWQAESWASCASTYHTWQDWWEKNRQRYPAAAKSGNSANPKP